MISPVVEIIVFKFLSNNPTSLFDKQFEKLSCNRDFSWKR